MILSLAWSLQRSDSRGQSRLTYEDEHMNGEDYWIYERSQDQDHLRSNDFMEKFGLTAMRGNMVHDQNKRLLNFKLCLRSLLLYDHCSNVIPDKKENK